MRAEMRSERSSCWCRQTVFRLSHKPSERAAQRSPSMRRSSGAQARGGVGQLAAWRAWPCHTPPCGGVCRTTTAVGRLCDRRAAPLVSHEIRSSLLTLLRPTPQVRSLAAPRRLLGCQVSAPFPTGARTPHSTLHASSEELVPPAPPLACPLELHTPHSTLQVRSLRRAATAQSSAAPSRSSAWSSGGRRAAPQLFIRGAECGV